MRESHVLCIVFESQTLSFFTILVLGTTMTKPTYVNSWYQPIGKFFQSFILLSRIGYEAAPLVWVALLVLRILQSIIPIAIAWIFKTVFDQLSFSFQNGGGEFEQVLLPHLAILGGLMFGAKLFASGNVYINRVMGRRVKLHASHLVYTHLLSLPGMYYFESPQFYDTVRLATQSLEFGPSQLINYIMIIFGGALTTFGFLAIIAALSPALALGLVLAVIPMFIANLRLRRNFFTMVWSNSPKERKTHYLSALLSNNQFAKETRMFNLGHHFLSEYIELTREINSQHHKIDRQMLEINVFWGALAILATVSTYIFVFHQAIIGAISLGSIILYIDALRNVQTELENVSGTIVNLSQETIFFTHYQNLIHTKSDLQQFEVVEPVPELKEVIEIRNLSFRYTEDGPYILKNLSLEVRKGECLALVGLNGAGKTTLVKLLARFYDPTDGQILWDGIDIRHFDPQAYRERLGATFQDFVRYDLTVRENIALGKLKYIDDIERIQSAARDAGVHDFILTLPQGYETVLSRWLLQEGELGTDLSGGQWQKIALARMYIRDVDLVMLDEPTAALDPDAERSMYEHYIDLAANRASILISHRFSTVQMADYIAVIENGELKEYGTHQQLMTQNQIYARLYLLQAQQYSIQSK